MDWLKQITLLVVLILGLLDAVASLEQKANLTDTKFNKRALSVFNVVRFPNDVCFPTAGGKNGTCYTTSECETRNGKGTGSCANGYGVCCVFTLGCGGKSSENCTYFDNPGAVASGTCTATICKINPDICSMRLDFTNFMITGPSTVANNDVSLVGTSVGTGGKASTVVTQCLTDTFTVTGNGAGVPPVICGTNTNQHMYVDASDNCNQLSFQLGVAGIGAAIANRAWSLKVSQLSCQNPNLPPPGCTQYYYGTNTGSFQSFNFGTGTTNLHLANQNQVICIRRERQNCRICYSTLTAMPTDFSLSSMAANGLVSSQCCGYGAMGTGTKGYDCVIIPGATKKAVKSMPLPNAFCGNKFTSINNMAAAPVATICSQQTPFQLAFVSNMYEFQMETGTKGFRLFYSMSCT